MIPPSLYQSIASLKYMPPDLFRRVFQPYRFLLAAVGIALDLESFLENRDRLPEPVHDLIDALARFSTAAGYAHLLAVTQCNEHNRSPSRNGLELAARLLLQDGEAFQEALRGCPPSPALPARVLVGEPLKPPLLDAHLQQRLLTELKLRLPHLGLVSLRAWTERGRLYFQIGRVGGLQRTHILRNEGIESNAQQPIHYDDALLDPSTGCLHSTAVDEAVRHAQAKAIGRVLTGEPDWFYEEPIVRMEALERLGRKVLIPTQGLSAVRLWQLAFADPGDPTGRRLVHDEAALKLLDKLQRRPMQYELPYRATFMLEHRSDKQRRAITIGVPDQVTVPWISEALAWRWLEERGLLSLPGSRR